MKITPDMATQGLTFGAVLRASMWNRIIATSDSFCAKHLKDSSTFLQAVFESERLNRFWLEGVELTNFSKVIPASNR